MTLDAERSDLLAALAEARKTLIATTDGLTDEQAGTRPTVSQLCLGGLLKHVASMERNWLRVCVEGPGALNYDLPEGVAWADILAGTAREYPQWMIDHQSEFALQPGDTLDAIIARYREIAAETEKVVADLPDLSVRHKMPDAPWQEPGEIRSVRGILLHVIAETTHHTGHADIIRETLDA